jgi:D-glycero-alpha-D-manno-heptose-7-phosphate kinase
MILTRTPFRVTLGGGGTDLKSYYSKHGGFIFSFTLDKYMYITLKKAFADDLIRVKYSESETVEKIEDLKHEIARACIQKVGFSKGIEIASMADIPSGSGLGSSSTYTVGLLSALHNFKRDFISTQELAEEACEIEIDILKKPMGKQDQYLAAYGGFLVMEISKDGSVKVKNANISLSTLDDLKQNLMIFYTGKRRLNKTILGQQDQASRNNETQVMESLNYIKESGYKILESVESGNITDLGILFDEHWKYKKKMAQGISSPELDQIYELAKENGAIGGKISGAGGGGFFTLYCEDNKSKLREAMKKAGLRELTFDFDFEGTKVLGNFMNYSSDTLKSN